MANRRRFSRPAFGLSLLGLGLFGLILTSPADEPLLPKPKKQDWTKQVLSSFKVTVEPAQLKPGQVGTFRIELELKPDSYTYPLQQPEPGAAQEVNRLSWPEPGSILFVGSASSSKNYKTKSEPILKVKEYRFYTDRVTYERSFVVHPAAAAGPLTIELPAFEFAACWKGQCYPAKKLPTRATLEILPGPAVPVPPEWAEEVRKVLLPAAKP